MLKFCLPPIPFLLLNIGIAVSACSGSGQGSNAGRYRVEVLAPDVDSTRIPDQYAVDFDEDGSADRVVATDTSLQVLLSGGEDFTYRVGEAPGAQVGRIDDLRIFSFNRDGSFPSLVLATRRVEPEVWWGFPTPQLVVVNEEGSLSLKRLWRYSVPAIAVDCAWLESSVLPVCFYATYALQHVQWGVSGLVELDVEGWSRMIEDSLARGHADRTISGLEQTRLRYAMDSAYWAFTREQIWGLGEVTAQELAMASGIDSLAFERYSAPRFLSQTVSVDDTVRAVLLAFLEESNPREFVRSLWRYGMDAQKYDSILNAWDVPDSASAGEIHLALVAEQQRSGGFLKAKEVTREHGLPWPAHWPPNMSGSSQDGIYMSGARFFDFSGDGLQDLIVVGQHSRIFSAIQHENGTFVEAQYHSVGDEYLEVFAPKPGTDADVTVPPCVYIAMELEQSFHSSDYVECYDRKAGEWYEVALPGGKYAMRDWYEVGLPADVRFWDMNDDGMIDFTARRDDGNWTAFTFVREGQS